jgi:hypothetical protein
METGMQVTIHQPDFLPWYGFFNKVARSNRWIVLDHVENNPRDAAFWGRRVKILINGQPNWLSVPLNRAPGDSVGMPIGEMTLNLADSRLMGKRLRSLEMAYAAAPFFEEYRSWATEYFEDSDSTLIARNIRFIRRVMEVLKIDTEVLFSSEMNHGSLGGTELLVALLKDAGADSYRCGGGAAGYQDDALFEAAGIELVYNEFDHPTYPQLRADGFHPGLTILDALFNVGAEQVRGWLTAE